MRRSKASWLRVVGVALLAPGSMVTAGVLALPPAESAAQTRVVAWVGYTTDTKPGFAGSSSVSHSGPSFGACVIHDRFGVHGAFTDFSDSSLRDRTTFDLLLGYRWPLTSEIGIDLQAGPSFLERSSDTGDGPRDRSSTDWLLGPVLWITLPFSDSVGFELSVPVQLRWSPDHSDFLRLGIRGGVRFGL